MKVNAFIIGVQKAATTSLYECLLKHSDVCGETYLKEYPFFIDSNHYGQGYSALENKFNYKNESVVLTACVDYIDDIDSLKRIKKYNNKAKIIVVLRNPTDRIISAFSFLRQLGLEPETTLEQALKNNPEYLERSLYTPKIEALYSIFEPEQIKLILFEQLITESSEVVDEVLSFLGLEAVHDLPFGHANKTYKANFEQINRFLYDFDSNHIVKRIAKLIVPPKQRQQIRRTIRTINSKPANNLVVQNGFSDKLLLRLKEDRKALEKYIQVHTFW